MGLAVRLIWPVLMINAVPLQVQGGRKTARHHRHRERSERSSEKWDKSFWEILHHGRRADPDCAQKERQKRAQKATGTDVVRGIAGRRCPGPLSICTPVLCETDVQSVYIPISPRLQELSGKQGGGGGVWGWVLCGVAKSNLTFPTPKVGQAFLGGGLTQTTPPPSCKRGLILL